MITNAKISSPPFDIHKSKLVIVKWHSIKVGKTSNSLVFSTKLGSNSWEKLFFGNKKNFWTQMHTESFQPNTFHKLGKKMVFDN
jgi:hypothetical protein